MRRLYSFYKVGIVAVCLLSFLFFGGVNYSVAAVSSTNSSQTLSSNSTELQTQLKMLMQLLAYLQAQLAALQAQTAPTTSSVDSNLTYSYTNIDDGVRGTPSIKLTSNPGINNSFSKDKVNDPIKISWEANNVPVHTQVMVEIVGVNAPGPISGGTWGSAIATGDSRGVYYWNINGIGRISAGTYKVRVKLEECHPDGCNFNAHFPGREVSVKLYSVSEWRQFRVIGNNDTVVYSVPTPSVTVSASPSGVSAGENTTVSWKSLNAKRCVLQYGNREENIGLSGVKVFSPNESTTYKVWCANDSGDGKDGPSSSGSAYVSVDNTDESVTAAASPRQNAMSCNRSVSRKVSGGELACYGLWDFGNAFGDDQNECTSSDHSTAKIGCTIKTPICSSGSAVATRAIDTYTPWHKSGGVAQIASSYDVSNLARLMNTSNAVIKSQLITAWEYRCSDSAVSSIWSIPKTAADILVAGVYEGEYPTGVSRTGSNPAEGEVTVAISSANSENTILILSAYEPVHWTITGAGAKYIKGVFLTGYNEQRVSGLSSSVKVTKSTFVGGAGTNDYFVTYKGSSDTDSLESLKDYVNARTGLSPYLLFGGYDQGYINVGLKG